MVIPFLKYFLRAETKYGIHSPFVFEFIQEVLEDDRHYYLFDEIEYLRADYLKASKTISVKDLGSGSKKMKTNERRIKDIAKNSLTGPALSQFLFRLSRWKQPKSILELGTSLGISISYLAGPVPEGKVITLEGCPQTAAIAQSTLNKLGLSQVKIGIGAFSETLIPTVKTMPPLDLVFLDGHHALQPTLDYWNLIKPYLNEKAIIILDDIHWSKEMEEAWDHIRQEEYCDCSIDLFYKGLIFWKQPELKKQHFSIIPSRWKPWRMGFWT